MMHVTSLAGGEERQRDRKCAETTGGEASSPQPIGLSRPAPDPAKGDQGSHLCPRCLL